MNNYCLFTDSFACSITIGFKKGIVFLSDAWDAFVGCHKWCMPTPVTKRRANDWFSCRGCLYYYT